MEEQKKFSIKLTTLILIILVIVAIIVGVVFAVRYFGNNSEQNENTNNIYSSFIDRGADYF